MWLHCLIAAGHYLWWQRAGTVLPDRVRMEAVLKALEPLWTELS
jgi:hypothetical protein